MGGLGGVGGGMEVKKREIVYLSLHCHHQNDSGINMGNDEKNVNVSLIVSMRDKVTRQCPQTTTFLLRKRAEAKSSRCHSAYQPNALPLGQTGSQGDVEHIPSP